MFGLPGKKKCEPVQVVKVLISTDPEKLKKCKLCEEYLPLEMFSKNKKCKGGRLTQCKKCCKQYRIDNKEKITATRNLWLENNPGYQLAWSRKNVDKCRKSVRRYYENNTEKVKAKNREFSKKYYHEHQPECDAKRKIWCKNNPEKLKQYKKGQWERHGEETKEKMRVFRLNNPEIAKEQDRKQREASNGKRLEREHVRHAKKIGAESEKINNNEVYERDGWICQICLLKVDKLLKRPHPLSKSLDHIIPYSKGGNHKKDNVQLTHLVCNLKIRNRIKSENLLLAMKDYMRKTYPELLED